jgi:hypothetical protein
MRKSIRKQYTRAQFVTEVLRPALNAMVDMPYAVGTVDYSDLGGEVDVVTMSRNQYLRQSQLIWRVWSDPSGSGETFIWDDEASEEAMAAWHKAARVYRQLVRIYKRCWKTPLPPWMELN